MMEGRASKLSGLLASIALGFYFLPLAVDLFRSLVGTNFTNGDLYFVIYLTGYTAPALMAYVLSGSLPHFGSTKLYFETPPISEKAQRQRKALSVLYDYLALVGAASIAVLAGLEALGRLPGAGFWEIAIALSVALFAFSIFHVKELGRRTKRRIVATACALVIAGLVIGFAGYWVNSTAIAAATSPSAKVEQASQYVRNQMLYTGYGRISGDVFGFIITGLGKCQEAANMESWLLNQSGMTTRVVMLPGESHAFTEVSINGTWYASDPGYGLALVTTQSRGTLRLQEMGGLSLIWLAETNPPVFVTDQYVPTDTITIQVFKGGAPDAGGSITLSHKFEGETQSTTSIPLNANGIIVLKLGSMDYLPTVNADHFYWVYVNGAKTNYTVTSYGNYSSSYEAVYVP